MLVAFVFGLAKITGANAAKSGGRASLSLRRLHLFVEASILQNENPYSAKRSF